MASFSNPSSQELTEAQKRQLKEQVEVRTPKEGEWPSNIHTSALTWIFPHSHPPSLPSTLRYLLLSRTFNVWRVWVASSKQVGVAVNMVVVSGFILGTCKDEHLKSPQYCETAYTR